MTFSQTIPRALLAFVAIAIAQVVAGIIVPMKPVAIPHLALWMLINLAITVAALAPVAARAEWQGWRLGAAVAAIPLAVFAINLIEGVVFLPNTSIEWGKIFLYMLVSALLCVPVWAYLFKRKDAAGDHYHPIRSQSRGELVWKFVVCDLLYLFLYFAVGAIIFPYVKDFYATQRLPSKEALSALQLFVRGTNVYPSGPGHDPHAGNAQAQRRTGGGTCFHAVDRSSAAVNPEPCLPRLSPLGSLL